MLCRQPLYCLDAGQVGRQQQFESLDIVWPLHRVQPACAAALLEGVVEKPVPSLGCSLQE